MIGTFWFYIALGVLFLLVLALWAGWRISRWQRSQRQRNRVAIALQGESEAEKILESLGYTIQQRQVSAFWKFFVDGEEMDVRVRADLVVCRDGRQFVAEVKTGERAPNPCHPPTRRQLLEYSLVFGATEILLVDVEARVVRLIAFPIVQINA